MTTPTRRAMSLADLAALNQELAALVRAGVPLEPALARLAEDTPGRLGRFADEIAKSLDAGHTLAEAVARSESDVGPLYRAMVEAGARAGRLSLALDGMASACRRLADMRRTVTTAMIYPVLVALLTIPAGLFLGLGVLPRIRVFRVVTPSPASWETIEAARRAIPAWAPATGGAFALVGIAWWIWSRRSFSLGSKRPVRAARARRRGSAAGPGLDALSMLWPPRMASRMRREQRIGAVAQVLAELVGAGTPLPAALRLAGEATGEEDLAAACASLAVRIEQGSTPEAGDPMLSPLPRVLIWALGARPDLAELEPALRHVAATYRASADQRAEWLWNSLPAVLTASIGGAAVFTYALWLFLPWVRTLTAISGVTR